MRTRSLERIRYRDYRNRAEEFRRAMRDEADFERFNAAALLGIHALVSLTDALTVLVVGRRSASERHADAVTLLREASGLRGVQKSNKAFRRLGDVLSQKNAVAYEERYIATNRGRMENIRVNVEAFFVWAYTSFRDLGKEVGTDEHQM